MRAISSAPRNILNPKLHPSAHMSHRENTVSSHYTTQVRSTVQRRGLADTATLFPSSTYSNSRGMGSCIKRPLLRESKFNQDRRCIFSFEIPKCAKRIVDTSHHFHIDKQWGPTFYYTNIYCTTCTMYETPLQFGSDHAHFNAHC